MRVRVGRASARRFAAEGAKVVVADVAEDGGTVTVALIDSDGGKVIFVDTDVSELSAVENC